MQEVGQDALEKSGTRIPGKKISILAGIIVTVIIIAAISAYIIFQLPGNSENSVSPVTTNSALQHRISSTQHPTESQRIKQPVTYTVKETLKIPVDFVLQPGEQTSCGLTCRQLVATITNTGYETAHNVCITVSLHNSRTEVINLNGNPSIRRCIGDIAGGEAKTEPITVNADCGAFATKCIGETLTLQTQVSSDEKTIQFPDQLIAV
jgi:hypothetical protein